MSGVSDARVTCPGCGKRYRWRDDLAGRKVKCACGQVMTMPEVVPVDEEAGDAMIAMESKTDATGGASDACPVCSAPMAAGAVLCTACGFNTQTGSRMGTQVTAEGTGDDDQPPARDAGRSAHARAIAREHAVKQWIAPGVMLVVGVVVSLWLAAMWGGAASMAVRMIADGVGMFLGVGLSLAALFITAGLLGVSFGRLETAILKLAAIYIFPGAMGDAANLVLSPIGIIVSVGLYFWMLSWLFDLDFMETFICAVVIFAVKMLMWLVLIGVLISLLA